MRRATAVLLLICAALCAGVHLHLPAARTLIGQLPQRPEGDADLWLALVTAAGAVLHGAGHLAGATRDQALRSAASLRRSVRILHQVQLCAGMQTSYFRCKASVCLSLSP